MLFNHTKEKHRASKVSYAKFANVWKKIDFPDAKEIPKNSIGFLCFFSKVHTLFFFRIVSFSDLSFILCLEFFSSSFMTGEIYKYYPVFLSFPSFEYVNS